MKYTAIIIGAGPAGIGLGIVLKQFGVDSVIIEKNDIGNTFSQWPITTKFITPSFTTNGFGVPDINAITPDTSPAYTFKKEHINGREYQEYLKNVVSIYNLNVQSNTEVLSIKKNKIFEVFTTKDIFKSSYVFIGTGDFSFPNKPFTEGKHYSEIKDFKEIKGNHITIIGANESGIDSAINLAKLGKRVTIISKTSSYNNENADPSVSLSPYTQSRFKEVLKNGSPIRLLTNRSVTSIQKQNCGYEIYFTNQNDRILTDDVIQATGFSPIKNPLIQSLFDISKGKVQLSPLDESTLYRNAFLIGSTVQNQNAILCYIYKFRARFAVLAKAICERENIDISDNLVDYYKQNQMFLDDYKCCDVKCSC